MAMTLPGLVSSMLLFCLLTGLSQAQTRYKVIRLPTPDGYNSTALGLNDSGNVVGYSYQGDNSGAFLYDYAVGTIKDLGSLGGRAIAATAINNANEVVGYGTDTNGNVLAFRYTQSQGIGSLGTLVGGSNSEAFAINGSGRVAGDSQADGDAHRPTLFTDNGVKDLGISVKSSDTLKTGYGINAQGAIVGRYDTDGGSTHGFLFSANHVKDLGTLGGGNSEALAVNSHGIIVGDSETNDGSTRAFLFNGTSMQDLGALSGFTKTTAARSINNRGQIVGESDSDTQKRAFVYTNGQMFDLTQAAINLRQAGFSALDVADGINDHGWIVGFGTTFDGRLGAFLAIPVGVTEDPPGGPDAPVFNSGEVGGLVWIGGGWFCPPTLWPPPWGHHHRWPKPPRRPLPLPTPRGTPDPRPVPTPTPKRTPIPPWHNPPPGPTPAPPSPTRPLPLPTPQPTPAPRPSPTPILTAVPPSETSPPKSPIHDQHKASERSTPRHTTTPRVEHKQKARIEHKPTPRPARGKPTPSESRERRRR
jgi:probable HAF family extracellular repeat protein